MLNMRRLFVLSALTAVTALTAIGPATHAFAQQSAGSTYVVQPGDNLFRISLRFGVSISQVAALNGIDNPNLIFVGQTLQIPTGAVIVINTPVPGTTVTVVPPPTTPVAPNPTPAPVSGAGSYVVQPGDNLFRISLRFGVSLAAIAQANGILNPNLIFVGETLTIPAGGTAPVPGTTPITAPPPSAGGGFATGGQVVALDTNAQNAMRNAHMTWVKRQLQYGDNGFAGLISEAHNAGFKILLSVVGDKNAVLNAGYFDQFAAFVGQVAGQGADAIEVWNEENLDRQWPTGQINASTYVQLLAKSYAAIKAANANTIVISGAPSPTGAQGAFPGAVVNDDVYYAGMAAAGAARYADCIGVHYNEGIVSPNQTSGDPRGFYPTRYFSTMLSRALASFPGKAACFTEIGYLTPQGYGPLPSNFSWAANTTIDQQAQWIGQAAALARSGGQVRLMIVFNVNFTYYGADDPQAGYALIRADGTCPGCTTLGSQ